MTPLHGTILHFFHSALGEGIALLVERRSIDGEMHRAAVGEDLPELRAGHARPGADAAGVHVDEGAARGGVIAGAADLVAHRGGAQGRRLDALDVGVHALPFMCWLFSATPEDLARSIALVLGSR